MVTTIRPYDEFYAEVLRLHQAQSFGDVLDLLQQEGDNYPDEAQMVLYLRSCMTARTGDLDQALDILQDALDRGFWYGEQLMRESPSWQVLQGLPRFEAMTAVCLERQQAARTAPRLFVEEPEGGCAPGANCPLFLALHGNGSNARLTLAGWRPVVAAGWLLAVPQSSQGMSMDSYVWNDQEIAQREVAEHYATVTAEHGVDTGRVVLAGFSMGGETALRAALVGTVPAHGFILLGPGGPTIDTPDAWLPMMENAAGRGLRGTILLGENDVSIPHDAIRTLVDHLNAHGIPCELEIVPGIRHEYPQDFAPYLARALAFVESAA